MSDFKKDIYDEVAELQRIVHQLSSATNIEPEESSSAGNVEAISSHIATAQTTVSAVYVDLATVGPSVTINVPASGKIHLAWACHIANSNASNVSAISLNISGANVHVPTDNSVYTMFYQAVNNSYGHVSNSFILTGLNPGITTFKMMYRAQTATTGTFRHRIISIMPLP